MLFIKWDWPDKTLTFKWLGRNQGTLIKGFRGNPDRV